MKYTIHVWKTCFQRNDFTEPEYHKNNTKLGTGTEERKFHLLNKIFYALLCIHNHFLSH